MLLRRLPAGCWRESESVLGLLALRRLAELDGCTVAGPCLVEPTLSQQRGETEFGLEQRSLEHRGHSHFPPLDYNNGNQSIASVEIVNFGLMIAIKGWIID